MGRVVKTLVDSSIRKKARDSSGFEVVDLEVWLVSGWNGRSKCVARLRTLGAGRGHVLERVSRTAVVAATASTVRIRALRFEVTDVFAAVSDNWSGESKGWLNASRDVEVVDKLLCVIRVEVEAMN